MLQFRMGVHPGFEVVGFECLELIVFEVDEIVTIGDAAFGDMSAKLAAKHTVQFAGGEVGIVLQHGIDELVQAVQTLCLWLELQEVFQLQYVATFENGLVLVVDDGIAVGLVLGAMKDQIDTKLLLHQLAKLFFVGSHIAILQEDGTELFPSALIGFEGLQVLLDGGQRQGVDDVTIALDAEIAVFLVAFVAAGFEDGTELIESRKLLVEGIFDGLRCPLLLVTTGSGHSVTVTKCPDRSIVILAENLYLKFFYFFCGQSYAFCYYIYSNTILLQALGILQPFIQLTFCPTFGPTLLLALNLGFKQLGPLHVGITG